jgi:DNA-binding SARP family transcriptional activator/tetratricopeptide (TPR) repeat protein
MIRLRTLGALDLRNADGSELRAIVAQPKRLALLVYLGAATPHGFHRRDSILSLFWPDRDLEHARASLSRALYFLRRELGPGVIVSRGAEEIGLDQKRIWCDAAAFDDAVGSGRHGDALDLCRGELLPGFFLSDAAGFEEWLESQRTRLRESASGAAWQLADHEEAAGHVAAAVHLARRGVELTPFREEAFRRFLALLDRAGDRAGAAHAYAKFTEDIARELDVSPSPETQRLIDGIKSRAGAQTVPHQATMATASDASAHRVQADHEAAARENIALAPAPRRRWTSRSIAVGATAAGVLGAVSLLLMATKRDAVDPSRVDVAPWTNQTGDRTLDRLGVAASEQMVREIRQTGIVEDSRILRPWSRKRAGTVVTGHFDRAGSLLRVHVSVTDVRRGAKPWPLAPVVVSPDSLARAIDSVRPRVLGAIAVLQHPFYGSLLPLASPPPSFDAFHEFLAGLKLQTDARMSDALDRYRWAAAVDSGFTWALVHGGMVSLHWYRADLKAQTDSFITALRVAHGRLTPLQSHLLDYMSAVRATDWMGSYRAMRAAAEVAPNQYGLQFAQQANAVNRPREALDALTRPGMDSIHRRNIQAYWRRLTFSLHLLGEHERELSMARRAREIDRQSVSALVQEMRALAALGRLPAVSATLDTLTALPKEDWLSRGYAATWVAMELRAHGYADASSETMQRAIASYRSRPADERRSQEWREWFADALYAAGDFSAADTAFRSLMREFPTSYGYPDNALYLGRIGAIAARLGDVVTATAMSEKLIKTDRFQPQPGQESRLYRAKIAALLGNQAEAMRLLTSAYGPFGANDLHDDMDFETMKSYAPFQEFMRPKG